MSTKLILRTDLLEEIDALPDVGMPGRAYRELMLDRLEVYLRRRRIWTMFVRESGLSRSDRRNFLLTHEPRFYIRAAFTWEGSARGHDFWARVDEGWAYWVGDKAVSYGQG